MSGREKAIQLLNAVPDYKIQYVIAYLQGVTTGEAIPNVVLKNSCMRPLPYCHGPSKRKCACP